MCAKIYYKTGYKNQLARTFSTCCFLMPAETVSTEWIELADEVLTIKRGYAWDGDSGPGIQTPSTIRASCVHDALYQLIRLGLLDKSKRKIADKIYRHIALQDGMLLGRANLRYALLRAFGGYAILPEAEPATLSAP